MARLSKVDNFSEQELKDIVSNSYSWRELYRNLGYASSNESLKQTILRRLNKYQITTEHFTSLHTPRTVIKNDEEIFIKDTPVATKTIRDHYRNGNYSEYKCSICGLEPFWNGKELVLTLDHINGIHSDSRLENLRWVCPNCDRQLDTFSGRNFKRYK